MFRHAPFAQAPGFVFYEIETGPLNAGVFPKSEFDTTLGTERLFLYPDRSEPLGGFAEVKTCFNFGVADIDAAGRLTMKIVTAIGEVVYTLTLQPQP